MYSQALKGTRQMKEAARNVRKAGSPSEWQEEAPCGAGAHWARDPVESKLEECLGKPNAWIKCWDG